MDLSGIKDKAERFLGALQERDRKRALWNTHTKDLIFNTLSEIKASAPKLEWAVQHVNGGRNLQAVNIQFYTRNSGIVIETGTHRTALIKHGGYITFSQAYNGDIFVILVYPYIEDHTSELPNELLDKISPDNITPDYVLQKVDYFLDKMIGWELSTLKKDTDTISIEPIGFRPSYFELKKEE